MKACTISLQTRLWINFVCLLWWRHGVTHAKADRKLDKVAKWLWWWIANPLCSAREGLNPILVAKGIYWFLALYRGMILSEVIHLTPLKPKNSASMLSGFCKGVIFGWFHTRRPGPYPIMLDPKVQITELAWTQVFCAGKALNRAWVPLKGGLGHHSCVLWCGTYEMCKQLCPNKRASCYITGRWEYPGFFMTHGCCGLETMTQQLTYMHVRKEPEYFGLIF